MRTDLPSGTVTFLFTDVEGSTQQVQRLGESYTAILATQRKLLRSAFHKFHGREVDTQGDSFFVAFARAADAIAASVMAQRALAEHAWPAGKIVRVRMGLHTGAPQLTAAGYVGLDVHIAARLCAAAHGGQVLLSQATRDLVEQQLPDGVRLRDLGEHRLKDLNQPHHIFQLVISALPNEFPQLRSLDALPHNLPIQLTSFVGREREIAEIKRLLMTTRLLTLTGAGGAGKTRLALQVAADLVESHDNGVWLIELAPLTDPALVPQAVAAVLGVREQPGQPILNSLVDHLRSKNMLLVVDNCEHVIDACARLADALLRACPNLRLLATSREALGIAGETAWTVPSLSLPDVRQPRPTFADLSQYEAVQLFVDRAVAVQPSFKLTELNASAVAQVCQRLDGIPLAIELAAARVKVLKTPEIAARLDDRFNLLTAGSRTALLRHQTLRGAIDWSYDLLTEPERVLLRRLSVFAGGCTLEAAESVCSLQEAECRNEVALPPASRPLPSEILDLLSHLVDKSLVIVDKQGGETRYHMLETIRQYAREKLVESGESERVQNRHLEFFLHLAEEANPKLDGTEAIAWSHRLEVENDNLRAALEWSLGEERIEKGLRLAVALAQYWQIRGYLREGRARLEALLSRSKETSASVRALALQSAGFLSSYLNDIEQATEFFEKALALNRDLDDQSGIAFQLVWLGFMAEAQGEYTQARTFAEQGLILKRELGDQWGAAVALFCLAEVAYLQSDFAQATASLDESLALCREIGNIWAAGRRLTRLGQVTHALSYPERAITLLKEGLVACREAGDYSGIAWALAGLAGVARAQGELVWAVRLMGSVAAFCEETGAALWFLDHKEYERNVAIAREQLDVATFNTVWAEGRAMTLEQAIEYALGPPVPPEQVAQPRTPHQAAKKEFGGLTAREREVAARIAQGKSNREIANQLVVSERTVESHVANILNKLGFTARTQIAAWAVEKGLARQKKE